MTTRSRIVAELVVDEWRSHIGQLTRFGTIPTTMLLSEMIDLCPSMRDAVLKGIMLALNFDTALRFDRRDVVELPPLESISTLDTRHMDALAKLDLDVLQSSYLLPILEKFAKIRGTSPLAHSASLTTELQQPPDVLKHIEHMLHSMPLHELVTMNNVHKRLKSVILPMELLDGVIGATQALRASRLEETLQAASWGINDEFLDHEETMLKELNAALRFREAHIHSGT
uniref:Uncharacterized protein n=2 Tax=Babesia bovis TaxID=5865 RepID=A7AUZ8_BABBO|eukprot:XP_001609192.1 hypothetical protein [Babesia bovis T2Bo]